MRVLTLAVLGVLLCSPTLAGNARSERTAWQYRRWLAQQQHLNRQWAQHFHALRRDQQRAWRQEPGYTSTRTWQWQENRRRQQQWYRQQWQATQQRAWRR